ncbi:MAG: pseudouridine synthase [Candidatus Omnitrophota bacterium]
MSKPKGERLQVVLARCGVASRRGVVSLIEEGKVRVNGQVVREKGFRVDAATDKISVGAESLEISTPREMKYFVLNKPKGVMTTLQDPHAERMIGDFFTDVPERVFPVGRLDRDTTGLILVTNDGELAYCLTHPKFGVKKRYRAKVRGLVTAEAIKSLEKGVALEEGRTAPCRIETDQSSAEETVLFVTLHEGKKRQIRRMFESVGHRVLDLERLSYGPLELGGLKPGQRRELAAGELAKLRKAAGLG